MIMSKGPVAVFLAPSTRIDDSYQEEVCDNDMCRIWAPPGLQAAMRDFGDDEERPPLVLISVGCATSVWGERIVGAMMSSQVWDGAW